MKKFLKLLTTTVLAITLLLVDGLPFMSQGVALAQTSTKPNILVIMGTILAGSTLVPITTVLWATEPPT